MIKRGDNLNNVRRKRIPPSTNKLFPILILIAAISMSIGYASINSISMGVNGEVIAKTQEGIFITEVNYDSDINADLEESKILNAYQTILHSNISLSDSDAFSILKYKVTIYNSSSETYYYLGYDYIEDDSIYNNPNIEISVEGINLYSSLVAGESKEFYVVFSYKDSLLTEKNNLESYINFVFKKRYIATNMLENGSFENTVTLDYIVQSDSKFIDGSKSGMLVAVGNTFDYLGYYDFYSEHIYYFSGYFDIVTLTGNNNPYLFFEAYIWLDDNWGESQWHLEKFNNYNTTNGWEKWSFRSIENFDGTDIPIMLGVFDSQFEELNIEAYFDSFVLIDLTETFGVGNEPELEWCDQNIKYFDGTEYIYK